MARKRKYRLPAFLPVHVEGQEPGYVSVEDVLDDPELTGQAVNKLLAELEEWRRRWGDFAELVRHGPTLKIVRTIDRVKREMGLDWPTLDFGDGEDLAEDG